MKFTAEQIAGMLEGTVEGNSSAEVSGLSKIEEGKAGTLTFLANPKYISHIYSTGASIAIVSKIHLCLHSIEWKSQIPGRDKMFPYQYFSQ